MDINKLIKEAHEMTVKKGFWDCPDCKGKKDLYDYDGSPLCDECGGDGIIKNANIPEKLMLIVSELGEAQEALRKNKHAEMSNEDWDIIFKAPTVNDEVIYFKEMVKDTFEDEIADVYIRLADLCGYLKLNLRELLKETYIFNTKNISEILFIITQKICEYNFYPKTENWAYLCFQFLNELCNHLNIDIDKHITAKMAYNATRPYKHGKEF